MQDRVGGIRTRQPTGWAISEAGLDGLREPCAEIGLDVDVAHTERTSHAHGRKVSRLYEAVHRHRRHTQQFRDFLHCEEARFCKGLRHPAPPLLPTRQGNVHRAEIDVQRGL